MGTASRGDIDGSACEPGEPSRPLQGVSTQMATKGASMAAGPPGEPDGGSDRALWHLLREADQQAFAKLFHRYSDAVYNFAFRRTASWSVSEDVVQATFT